MAVRRKKGAEGEVTQRELAEARAQQAATAEILKVIARSPSDVQPVFDAIAANARRLLDANAALVARRAGNMLELAAYTSTGETADAELRKLFPSPITGKGHLGKAILTGQPVGVSDILTDENYSEAFRASVRARGLRSLVSVPLMRDGDAIGVISVNRTVPGNFSDHHTNLLKTFADQAVIAIENVRLFNEARSLQEERLSRLKSFFSPQLAELIGAGKGEELLKTHRREITVQFFDLRGFTAFTAAAEPEEVMELLREFHGALGCVVMENEGTIERFGGDSVMVFFNDPLPVDRPAERAVRTAIAVLAAFAPIAARWSKRGFELGLGVGIAQGYATLGAIGFEGRRDYAAIGPVTNLAARLCGEAQGGQILADSKTMAALEGAFEFDAVKPLALKGFPQPVPAFALVGQSRA
jgi:class 3 adenylate cyclase/putative methionine-R-sulfoxide reductase with GAF domain